MTLVRLNNSPRRTMFPEFFNDMMESFFKNDELNTSSYTRPLSNVKDTDGAFLIEFALPGFSKNDVDIDVNDHVLTVSSKKEETKNEEQENYTRREFYYGEFKRSFTLPEGVDEEKIKATFKDGILNVEIPKKPELQPRSYKVAIK